MFYCWDKTKKGIKRLRICKGCKYLEKITINGKKQWTCTY